MEFNNGTRKAKKRAHIASKQHNKVLSSSPVAKAQHQPENESSITPDRPLLSKKATIISIFAVVIVILIIGLLIHRDGTSQNINTRNISMNPEYPTVLPKDSTIDTLGGWQRISPPNNDPVFAYSDTIGDIPISVSQQPLPDSLKDDARAKVADVAKKFNATNKLDAGGATVYIGTSAKGPQSVILTKKNLLILIKSQKKIDDAAWVSYVQTLG